MAPKSLGSQVKETLPQFKIKIGFDATSNDLWLKALVLPTAWFTDLGGLVPDLSGCVSWGPSLMGPHQRRP